MQETQVGSVGQEDHLEKGMATHSSILVWRVPWTEEAGRLQPVGSQSQTRLSDFTFTQSTRMGLGLLCSLIYPECSDHCLAHEWKGACAEGTSIY